MRNSQVLLQQPPVPEAAIHDKAQAKEVISITDLRFSWHDAREPVLDIDTQQINKGERVFIEGPSGCGKSTLLNLLDGVVTLQEGIVTVLDRLIDTMSGAERDRWIIHVRTDPDGDRMCCGIYNRNHSGLPGVKIFFSGRVYRTDIK